MPIVFLALIAIACGVLASHKGRGPIRWGVFGFFVPLLALILILVLPDLKKEKKRHRSLKREQQLLREQLRQERLKRKALQKHVVRRLDAHDAELGIDTRRPRSRLSGTRGALANGHPENALDLSRQNEDTTSSGEAHWELFEVDDDGYLPL